MILIPPAPVLLERLPTRLPHLPVETSFCRCPVVPLSSFSQLTWFVLRCLLAELTLTQVFSRSPVSFQSFPGWFPLTCQPPCENVSRHPTWRAFFCHYLGVIVLTQTDILLFICQCLLNLHLLPGFLCVAFWMSTRWPHIFWLSTNLLRFNRPTSEPPQSSSSIQIHFSHWLSSPLMATLCEFMPQTVHSPKFLSCMNPFSPVLYPTEIICVLPLKMTPRLLDPEPSHASSSLLSVTASTWSCRFCSRLSNLPDLFWQNPWGLILHLLLASCWVPCICCSVCQRLF